jgi:25S rRNA (uracil2634-N3)-methyltransferase
MDELCVPCAYKVGCFDVALDRTFTKIVPNQRPEQCPRATLSSDTPAEGILGYCSGMSVLTVGDGDLSFSLALARLLSKGTSLSGGGRLVVTSYESRETLERVYPNFCETLSELQGLGARIEYEVDATRLADTLDMTNATEPLQFHRIVWNFPCTAISQGQDGQNAAMEDNKNLVRRFVQGARHLLHDNGEIHMSHKTKPPFNQWKLEEVAVEDCKGDPIVKYRGRVVLDRFTMKPYTPRKALDRKSFPCHDACFYIFGVTEQTKQSLGSDDSFPSSIPNETSNVDEGHEKSAALVPVTKDLIAKIRNANIRKAAKQGNATRKKNKKKKYRRI